MKNLLVALLLVFWGYTFAGNEGLQKYFEKLGVEAKDFLLEATYSDNPAVRYYAIKRIGELKIKDAITRLEDILLSPGEMLYHKDHPDWEVDLKRISIWALGQIGNKKSVSKLMRIYETSKDVRLKVEVIRSLSNFKTQEIFDFFSNIVSTEKDMRVVKEVVIAFGKLGNPDAIKPLMNLITNNQVPDDIKRLAFNIMQKLKVSGKKSNSGKNPEVKKGK